MCGLLCKGPRVRVLGVTPNPCLTSFHFHAALRSLKRGAYGERGLNECTVCLTVFLIDHVASVSVWSLTLPPRSLLVTHTETLATQAWFFSLVMTISSHQRKKKGNTDLLPLPSLCLLIIFISNFGDLMQYFYFQ